MWVRGIKEARIVQPERDGKEAIPKPVREVVELPASSIGRTVRGGTWVLPLHTGAGPCGTFARAPWRQRIIDPNKVFGVATRVSYVQHSADAEPVKVQRSLTPLAWSVQHLLEPLAAYYAAYVPPRRFGAKDTPRGRRCRREED